MLKISDIIQIRIANSSGDFEMESLIITEVFEGYYGTVSLKTGELFAVSKDNQYFTTNRKEKLDIILNLIERANAR